MEVFHARESKNHGPVTLYLWPDPSPEFRKRFAAAMEPVCRLRHRHLLSAWRTCCDQRACGLVVEHAEGALAETLVEEQGPLPLDCALECVLQAARGLEFAHQQGLVHGDVQPRSLFLDDAGCVRVSHLGLAQLKAAPPSELEEARRGDIAGLARTFSFLVTGEPAASDEPVAPLRKICPEATPAHEAVLHRMSCDCRGDGYRSMSEVAAVLEKLVEGGCEAEAIAPAADCTAGSLEGTTLSAESMGSSEPSSLEEAPAPSEEQEATGEAAPTSPAPSDDAQPVLETPPSPTTQADAPAEAADVARSPSRARYVLTAAAVLAVVALIALLAVLFAGRGQSARAASPEVGGPLALASASTFANSQSSSLA